MRWNKKVCSGKKLLASLMDSEDLVDQRPYSVAYDGIRSPLIHSPTNRVIDLPPKDRQKTGILHYLSMLIPGYLPVFHEDVVTTTVYRPDRLARQFGYDQGVPGPAPAFLGFIESYKRFNSGRVDPYLRKYSRIVIPSCNRIGGCTQKFRSYWFASLAAFSGFCQSPAVPVSILPAIFKGDHTLQSISPKTTTFRGAFRYFVSLDDVPSSIVLPSPATPIPDITEGIITRGQAAAKRLKPQKSLLGKRKLKKVIFFS